MHIAVRETSPILPLLPRPGTVKPQQQDEGVVAGTLRTIVPALIIALVIRTCCSSWSVFRPAMKPMLLIGDYLLVSKFTYGYTHYSLPFGPPLYSGRVFAALPKRGDIVVFRSPTDDTVDLIKRTIGMPGDRIEVKGGLVRINGAPVKRERIADFVGEDPCQQMPVFGAMGRVSRWRETLPNGVSYNTLECPLVATDIDPDNTPVYNVPAEHFFMMGDNRHNSVDSRFLNDVGYVPFENLIGRAQVVFFTVAEGESAWHVWRWPWSVRWGRLGTLVR
jgi:signal peptidase I